MRMRHASRDAGTVYRDLAPVVLAYLRAQRVVEPEDLLGEVFLQVARDIKRAPEDAEALRRWVFTVARHRVIDDARLRARRPMISTRELPEVPDTTADPGMDPALLAAVDRLTPDQREVVLLRFVADLPLDAVAKMTGRQVGSVKALQHRALAQLAKAVSSEARPTP
jgi:RNA polymerase sigma-70 factor, ECF subfamily